MNIYAMATRIFWFVLNLGIYAINAVIHFVATVGPYFAILALGIVVYVWMKANFGMLTGIISGILVVILAVGLFLRRVK